MCIFIGRRDDLAKHKRRKHTVKKCDECNFTTYKKGELANHQLEIHPPDNYIEERAFNRKLVNRIFETDRGEVGKIWKQVLEKKNIKSYITMKIRMYIVDQEGESIETDAGLNGGTRALISTNDIDAFYEVSRENILEDFATSIEMEVLGYLREL